MRQQNALKPQCRIILDLLKLGPVTNMELVRVALKYGARLSELRQAGFDVRMVGRGPGGMRVYALAGYKSESARPRQRTLFSAIA